MRRSLLVTVALLFAAAPARADTPPETPPGGALEAYLQQPQARYGWTVLGEEATPGEVTILRLELTSQTWRGMDWKHRLNVIVPPAPAAERARPGHAILAISGTGSEQQYIALLSALAIRIGAPVAILHDVPNQPLFKEDTPDGRGLREDALIAKTFVEFMRSGERDWPLLLPMTRAAVAAMDALGELSAQRAAKGGWSFGTLDRFVTTGASKRGWTTWLTAVVEPRRVIGIAPIVYDNLNVGAQLARHFEVWGKPSPQIHDYTDRGLLEFMQTPRGKELMGIVDPYAYRSRLALPKLALMGTNDTYWPLDAVNLYRGDLPGDFYCHYVPNAGHTAGLSVVDAVAGFFDHVTRRLPPLPAPTLLLTPKQSARVLVDAAARGRVSSVRVWTTRIDGKDFTKAQWEHLQAAPGAEGWDAQLPARFRDPGAGSSAFIGEVQLKDSTGAPFSIHSPVQVWELASPQN